MRCNSYLLTTTLLVVLGLSGYGCGGAKKSKGNKRRLNQKTYSARVKRCEKQLQSAHLTEIARWMKEKAETKKLAAGVDKMLTGKKTRPLFQKMAKALMKVYLKLIDNYPSKEAFQKAVKEGPRKEVAACFKKSACGPFAQCVATAITLLVIVAFSLKCYRKIGGATGDTLGATCELAETAFVVTLAAKHIHLLA